VNYTTLAADRHSRPSSLADVLDVVLDKGVVIDAYVKVAVLGIELLTIDARIVVASVDTYLRFAEAVDRVQLRPEKQVGGLPGLVDELREGGAEHKVRGALRGAKETAKETAHDVVSSFTGDDDEDRGPAGSPEVKRQRTDEADPRAVPQARRAPQRGGA
jgi:gas vesicle structural protein